MLVLASDHSSVLPRICTHRRRERSAARGVIQEWSRDDIRFFTTTLTRCRIGLHFMALPSTFGVMDMGRWDTPGRDRYIAWFSRLGDIPGSHRQTRIVFSQRDGQNLIEHDRVET